METKKPPKPTTNIFKVAVEATPDVSDCFKDGLQALRENSLKIELSNTRSCQGSVDIDNCTNNKNLYINENRWDYVIGYQNQAYFVEVHPASTSDIDKMLKKVKWLQNWLNQHAPEIKKLKAPVQFYWVQSGKFDI